MPSWIRRNLQIEHPQESLKTGQIVSRLATLRWHIPWMSKRAGRRNLRQPITFNGRVSDRNLACQSQLLGFEHEVDL
jgi:hypothetical protein